MHHFCQEAPNTLCVAVLLPFFFTQEEEAADAEVPEEPPAEPEANSATENGDVAEENDDATEETAAEEPADKETAAEPAASDEAAKADANGHTEAVVADGNAEAAPVEQTAEAAKEPEVVEQAEGKGDCESQGMAVIFTSMASPTVNEWFPSAVSTHSWQTLCASCR